MDITCGYDGLSKSIINLINYLFGAMANVTFNKGAKAFKGN